MENGMLQRMCKEAADEIARGDKGWREAETNVLLLACFHLLTNHLMHKISRPMWFFAGSICAAVIGYIISIILRAFSGG